MAEVSRWVDHLLPHPRFHRVARRRGDIHLHWTRPDRTCAFPRAGVIEGDVRAVGGLDKADSTCATRLRVSDYRADIERVVGASGRVEALFTTDRTKVAPTFYACAQSMSKFVVDRIGLDRTIALFPLIPAQAWAAALERDAGMPLPELQARWRAKLGLP